MTHIESLLDDIRADIEARRVPTARVRNWLVALDDPIQARKVGQLFARGGLDYGALHPMRVAIAATCTVGSFESMLRSCLVGAGAWPTITSGEYGTFELSLASGTFGATPDPDIVVCLMDERYFLPREWDPARIEELGTYIEDRSQELGRLVASSVARTTATVVMHTIPLPAEVRDVVISWRDKARLATVWNRVNARILELSETHSQVVVVDLVSVLTETPCTARDDRLHRYADIPYTDGALLALAREVRRIAQAGAGLSRKVLALDLDNTLWGGVLGEVGASGVSLGGLYPGNCYQQLQRAASRLRSQGVLLVLVSKNDADLVNDALSRHPDVLLRPESFSAMAVNWSAKAANLKHSAQSLGVATQSFVFMDDSRFERDQVTSELPEIAVVAADGDPAHLVRSLLREGWFDVMELTETDRERPQLYRTRALRDDYSSDFASSEDYLRALSIEIVGAPVDDFAAGRAVQLGARTNQFNLTGIRFDDATTRAMAGDPGHLVASFSVNDRFGSEGIVGAAWVRRAEGTWHVQNLVLSCRVLGRGVELAIAGWIARQAFAAGAVRIEGRFVPSAKNVVAAGFWGKAGFVPTDDQEVFALKLDRPPVDLAPSWIRIREGNQL